VQSEQVRWKGDFWQRGQKERQSNRLRESENECWGEMVLAWVENVCWRKYNTWVFLYQNVQSTVNQDLDVLRILRLIWHLDICSHNIRLRHAIYRHLVYWHWAESYQCLVLVAWLFVMCHDAWVHYSWAHPSLMAHHKQVRY
jgi:hypothetical protein